MAWPKGVKRVGYVRKDGKPHAAKGERIQVVRTPREVYTQTRKDPEPRIEKPISGASSRPIIEPCPNCGFAYADGGYCPECGWTTWTGGKRK